MNNEIHADYSKTFLFPPSVEEWVPDDHPVRFIREVLYRFDLAQMGFKERKSEEGRPSYSPYLLLGAWLYGYIENIYSSRALEKACKSHVSLIWLTGLNAPDHNTLWRFFHSNRDAIKQVFLQTVKIAINGGLASLTLQAIDGTKIAADVSKNHSVYLSDLKKLLSSIESSVDEVIEKIVSKDASESDQESYSLPVEFKDKRALKGLIERGFEELSMEKRQELRKGLKCEIQKLEEAGVNQLNLSDRDARMMKKGNGELTFCYNAQAVVDSESQIIVGARVSNDGSDNHLLTSMIDEATQNTGKICDESLADGGYLSGEELQQAENKGYEVLVNLSDDLKGESKKTKTATDEFGNTLNLGKRAFVYDQEKDVYICPVNHELKYEREKMNSSKSFRVKVYRCNNKACAYRKLCSNEKNGRCIERSPYEDALESQIKKQSCDKKRGLLQKRKYIVEPVFGWIKSNNKFFRWTYRGHKSVEAQWQLICSVINLKTLYKKWKSNELEIELGYGNG
jgi:transposase